MILKPEQIALVASKAGFKGDNLIIAVAVALAESRGNTEAVGDNGMSFGLWQINAHAHPNLIPGWKHDVPSAVNIANCSKTPWYDPFVNARFAYSISGGTHWSAWSTYSHETYKNKLTAAKAGVAIFLSNPTGITTPEDTTKSTTGKPMLRRGSIGTAVKELQTLLNSKGYTPKLEVDGEFGPLTLAGVKWFQTKVGIEVDGIVGPITWGKLLA